ncbi:MAG: carbohydrate binding domain-containing protein [Firmicutes bacterium]|nr:carbohydrate binding domain-containing protein [Bacillota bacterium]
MSEQKKRIIAFVLTFLMIFSVLSPVRVLAYEQYTPELPVYEQNIEPEVFDYGQNAVPGVFSFDIFNNGSGGSPSRPNEGLAVAGIIRMWTQLDGVNTPIYYPASGTIAALDQNGNCARDFVRVNRVWQDGIGWLNYFTSIDVDANEPWRNITMTITVHGQTVEVLLVNPNRLHPPASVVSYQMVVGSFDWGPGVTHLILALDNAVEPADVDAADLVASFYREPGFRFLFAAPFTPEIQLANITNAFVSDSNGVQVTEASTFVTLELRIHPGTGNNPFTFTLSPMGNNWANPFITNITWMDTDFVPERTAKIRPIADLFTRDQQFVYDDIILQYGYFVPPEAAESDRPVIIWLHGGGEGSRNLSAGTDAALLGNRVTQLAASEIQGIMGGAHVFVPQAPTMWLAGTSGPSPTGYVSNFENALLALIDHYLANTPGVDLNRIYVGGCSNGGYMTIRLLMRRPDMFAASFPICILYHPHWLSDEKVNSIAHVPMWMVHDIADPTTPHAHSLYLLQRLEAAGADNVHLTTTNGLFSDEFFRPDGTPWEFDRHWSWIPALNNTVTEVIDGIEMTLFEWMALQRLAAPGPVFSFDIFNNGPLGCPSRPNVSLATAKRIRMWTQLDGINTRIPFEFEDTIVATVRATGECALHLVTAPRIWEPGIGWIDYFVFVDVDKNENWEFIDFSITVFGQTVNVVLHNVHYVPSDSPFTIEFDNDTQVLAVRRGINVINATVRGEDGELIPASQLTFTWLLSESANGLVNERPARGAVTQNGSRYTTTGSDIDKYLWLEVYYAEDSTRGLAMAGHVGIWGELRHIVTPVAGHFPTSFLRNNYRNNGQGNNHNNGFEQTLVWSPEIEHTFLPNTEYTALLIIQPNARWANEHGGAALTPVGFAQNGVRPEHFLNLPTEGVQSIRYEYNGTQLLIFITFEATGAVQEAELIFFDDFSGPINPYNRPQGLTTHFARAPQHNNRQGMDSWRWDMSNIENREGDYLLVLGFERAPGYADQFAWERPNVPDYIRDNWIRAGAVRTRSTNHQHIYFEHSYGHFEARVKFPQVNAMWGAFWLMYHNGTNRPADAYGGVVRNAMLGAEIDVIETAANPFNTWNAASHWNGYSFDHADPYNHLFGPNNMTRNRNVNWTPANYAANNINIYDGEWHTFAVEWSPTDYIFFINDIEWARFTNPASFNCPPDWANRWGGLVGPSLGDDWKDVHFKGIAQNPNYIKLSVEAASWAGIGMWDPNSPGLAILDAFGEWVSVDGGEMLVDHVKVWNGPRPQVDSDRDELNYLYALSSDLNEADFTPEAWAMLQDALGFARLVLNSPNANQYWVDRAAALLRSALEGPGATITIRNEEVHNVSLTNTDRAIWNMVVGGTATGPMTLTTEDGVVTPGPVANDNTRYAITIDGDITVTATFGQWGDFVSVQMRTGFVIETSRTIEVLVHREGVYATLVVHLVPCAVDYHLAAVFLPGLSDWITVEESGSWIWVGRYVDFAVTASGLPAGSHNITDISFEHVGTGYLPTRRGTGGPATHHIPGEVDVRFTPVSFIVDENGIGTMRLYLHSSNVPRPSRTWDLELTVTVEGPGGPLVSEPIETILTDPGLWTLYWADEFEGDAINTDYWHFQIGHGHNYGVGNGWGNYELQFYRPENISVRDGMMVITAQHHSTPQGHPGAPGASVWTSGRLRTTGAVGVSTTYGRIEASISLPMGNALWPAFWMMPENSIYGGWAASGEIDIMESRGREHDRTSGAIHFGGQWPHNTFTAGYYRFPNFPDNNIRQFHTYAIEWEPGEIRWYVNDTMFMRQNRWHSRSVGQQADFTYPAPFDQDFHIILNLALGGVFDGGAVPDPSIFPLNMYVEYVRVWHQDTDVRPLRYPIHPDDMAIIPQPIPPEAKYYRAPGGLIWDTNFENVHVRTGGGNPQNPDMPGEPLFPLFDGWVVGSFAGGGNVSGAPVHTIDGERILEVQIAAAGGAAYNNQVLQRVSLVQGRHYRLSFDAWAAADRTIQVNIAQGGVGGWTNHTPGGSPFNLTTTRQSFVRYFTMTNPTQLDARLEINLGGNANNVFLGNVRLVEVSYIPIPEDDVLKFPLAGSSSLIWNGTFDQGRERMAFWGTQIAADTNANMGVNPARQFEVSDISGASSPADLILRQNRIPLFNDTYRLVFDARAAAARDIQFRVVSMATGSVFYTGTVPVGTTMERHTVYFTLSGIASGAAGYEMQFQFLFGGSTAGVILDNVTLVRQTFTDADWSGVTIYPFFNGDFFAGLAGWLPNPNSGGAAGFSAADGVAAVNVTALGSNPWNVELGRVFPVQENLGYTVTFEARAAAPRNIQVVVEHLPFGGRRIEPVVALTTEWQSFTFTWSEHETRDLALRFHMGQLVGAYTGLVELRNVNVFVAAGAEFYDQIPTFLPDTTNNTTGNAITLVYNAIHDPAHSTANPAFSAADRTVTVNGNVVAHTAPAAGQIVLPANTFTTAGTYVITISAPGFETVSFNQVITGETIVVPGGGFVVNGNFALPIVPFTTVPPYTWTNRSGATVVDRDIAWEFYLQSITADLTFPAGEGMRINFPGGAGQNPGGDMWHVQLLQRGIDGLTPGDQYRFIFEGRSSVDRDIWVGLVGGAGAAATRSTISLTQEWTRYERVFTGPLMPATGNVARNIEMFMGHLPASSWHGLPHTIDIRLVRIEPYDYEPYEPGPNFGIVYNSDFSLPVNWTPSADWAWVGDNGWVMMRAAAGSIPSATTGPDGLAFTMSTGGAADWFVQLSTGNQPNLAAANGQNIVLPPGSEHVVTITARASVARPALVALTSGGNGRRLLNLTEEWQTFTFPITGALHNNRITFYLGGNVPAIFNPAVPVPTGLHTIYFREVRIDPVEEQPPAQTLQEAHAAVAAFVDGLTPGGVTTVEAFTNAVNELVTNTDIVVNVNVTLTPAQIGIAGSFYGGITLTLGADSETIHVNVVLPALPDPTDGLVYNSNFALPISPITGGAWAWTGSNGWLVTRASGGAITSAATGPDGLALGVTPGGSNWFTQLSTGNQPNLAAANGQNIVLTPGSQYVVTITARASVYRPVLVAITAGGVGRVLIELTTEWQTFEIPITGPLFNNRITFYLGGPTGYEADGFFPTVPAPTTAHTVYFREVNIHPA